MENLKDTIFKLLRLDNIVNSLTGYVETRVELLKMEVREEMAKVISHGLMIVVLFLLGVLFLVFFSIGLAHYIGSYFADAHSGYWIVAGIYGVPCLILILFQKKISRFFERYLIEKAKQKSK